jgi:hypothetical protein
MALGVGVPSWLSSNSRASSGGGGASRGTGSGWGGGTDGWNENKPISPYQIPNPEALGPQAWQHWGTSTPGGISYDPTKITSTSSMSRAVNHESNWNSSTQMNVTRSGPPPATPVSATPNYTTGPTAYNNEAVPGTPGYGQPNPFDPNAEYALQLHWLENQLGRGQAQIGAHGELLNAQGRNLNAQYGFSNREGDLRLKAGEADRAYIDKSRLNIDQLRALYGEQAANEIAGLNQKADVNRRDINSKATAAGAYFFAGRGDHINDVNNDLANSTENVNLSTRQKLLSLDDRGNELENRSAKLDLLGSEVGLDRDKARAALEFGMAQLGYNKFLDSNQLLDMLDNKNSSQYDLLVNLVNQAFKVGVDWNTGAIGSDYQKFTGGQ